MITGSRAETGDTGRGSVSIPNRWLWMKSKLEQDAVQIRVRKGPMLPHCRSSHENTVRRTAHSVIGVCLVSQGTHQRLATLVNHPFFNIGTDV